MKLKPSHTLRSGAKVLAVGVADEVAVAAAQEGAFAVAAGLCADVEWAGGAV